MEGGRTVFEDAGAVGGRFLEVLIFAHSDIACAVLFNHLSLVNDLFHLRGVVFVCGIVWFAGYSLFKSLFGLFNITQRQVSFVKTFVGASEIRVQSYRCLAILKSVLEILLGNKTGRSV